MSKNEGSFESGKVTDTEVNKEQGDALDPGNLMLMLLIQSSRIYDLLMVLARDANKNEADRIVKMHQEGIWLCPPPTIAYPEQEENE